MINLHLKIFAEFLFEFQHCQIALECVLRHVQNVNSLRRNRGRECNFPGIRNWIEDDQPPDAIQGRYGGPVQFTFQATCNDAIPRKHIQR
jgi:hypothetical protein